MALALAPSTLRALIADGARAGIAPPFAGAERLRRWRGGPDLWLKWVEEVQKWRALKKETAASGSGGAPSPESPGAASAPTERRRGSSRPKSSARQPLHGIRHTFASVLAGAGVPELIIGALVGHAGSTTRDTYIDPASLWSAMVEAVAKIPPVGQCGNNMDERRRAAGGGEGK